MMEALEVLNRSFKEFLNQGDPRVKDWPLMQTPFPGIAMIVAYIYFVKVAGPQFMKKRKAYDLRNVMTIYNFTLVCLNFYIFMGIGWYGYFNGYSLKCQPVDYSNKYEAVRMAQMGYYFYLTKFIEFADTMFFVLRKKYNQISALHVIHHSIVPFSLWFGLKFAPGGYNAFFPFLNSFIHVIMYSYYGVAALGDKYKKYLFWKKYMTYMQLAQFVFVIIYAISMWYNKCDISKTFIAMNFIHAALFFGLFLNFFVKSYIRTPSRKKPTALANGKGSQKNMALAENENTPVKTLVSQIEKDVDHHWGQLHSCSEETRCRMRCRISPSRIKKGLNYNFCMCDNSLNSYQNMNGFSTRETLKSRKLLKSI